MKTRLKKMWDDNKDWMAFQALFQVPMLLLLAAAYYWDL